MDRSEQPHSGRHASSSHDTDEALLARYVRGDRNALGELARRYEPLLLGLACGMLNGRQDLARDAVQEAWVRVIRFAASFKADSSFKTWVYRIVINQCRTIRKGLANAAKRTDSGTDVTASFAIVRAATATDSGLWRAVDRLGEPKRDVLLLCYHRGMTHEHAAAILNVPVGTLKSRLNAALKELRALIPAEVMT